MFHDISLGNQFIIEQNSITNESYRNVNTKTGSYGTKYNLFLFEYFKYRIITGFSLLEINRRVIRSPFHDEDDDNNDSLRTNQFTLSDKEISSTKKTTKAWSVRARRDVPNLLRGDR